MVQFTDVIQDPVEAGLLLAAEVIADGWTQNYERIRDGNHYNYCALGAIHFAAGKVAKQEREQVIHEMQTTLAKVIKRSGRIGIVGWNDAKRRKKREVVAAFRKAARLQHKKVRDAQKPKTTRRRGASTRSAQTNQPAEVTLNSK